MVWIRDAGGFDDVNKTGWTSSPVFLNSGFLCFPSCEFNESLWTSYSSILQLCSIVRDRKFEYHEDCRLANLLLGACSNKHRSSTESWVYSSFQTSHQVFHACCLYDSTKTFRHVLVHPFRYSEQRVNSVKNSVNEVKLYPKGNQYGRAKCQVWQKPVKPQRWVFCSRL